MADQIVAPIVQGSSKISIDSQTLAQCLKTTNTFGETVYWNLCNGTHQVIPWGGGDWLIILMISGVVATFIGVMLAFAVGIIRDF